MLQPPPRRRLTALAALSLVALAAACTGDPVVGGNVDARADNAPVDDLAPDVAPDVAPDAAPDAAPDVADAPDAPGGCRDNAACAGDPGGPVCDTASGRCVRCVPSADTCPAAQHCDPMTFVCVDGCRSDEGCAAPAGDGGVADVPAGDGGADGGVPARVCDTAANRCVQCRVDDHCPNNTRCVGSVCVPGCSPTRPCAAPATCCDGACVDTTTNVAACGACGAACAVTNGTPACVAGRCSVDRCNAGFGDCDADAANGCETDTAASAMHCGMCGRACTFPNAAGACSAGTCAITRCNDGFGDCDGSPANGCETDLRTTATDCGTCGTACSFANAAATCAAGACAMGACNAGFADCDMNPMNGCETPTATTDNCGACGRSCSFANAAAACTMGACALGACRVGFADCDMNPMNGCEADLQTGAATCGMCGRACSFANATAACTMGACSLDACRAGFADCDMNPANGCESTLATDASNCGACARACAFPNAAATCAAGACVMGACRAGFADCDMNPANGCEVNLATNTAHCGRCGNLCTFAGGSASCAAGACVLTTCATGRGDCDGDRGNGCETDLNTAAASCGVCGNACVTANATPACAGGMCAVASCNAGFADCNMRAGDGCEVSTRTDATNCGACGRACALPNAVPACVTAACAVATCSAGFGDCDDAPANGCEVDLRTAVTSCGVCGRACSFPNAAATCAMGVCAMGACNAGFADCNMNPADGCEVDTRVNPSNCGSCGRACSFPNAAATCASGACAMGACNAGFADCDASPANGCEVDTRTEVTHCGACGRVCSTGRCAAGVCDRGGDGSDGALNVTTATTLTPAATPLVADAAAGATSLRVISTAGISAGNEVLVIGMQGASAGRYEYGRVASVTTNTITLAAGLANPYAGSTERVQVVRVLRYSALTVAAGQTLSVAAWNGTTGGVLPVRVSGAATIAGDLSASARGFRGGAGDSGGRMCGPGAQGESPTGVGGRSTAANGGGGGGGGGGVFCCGGSGQSPGGGGGAYGAGGANGTGASGAGAGGGAYGDATFTRIHPGGGGGGGGGNCDVASGPGGAGGGVILLSATTLAVTGNVVSAGAQGATGGGDEGAGAGGAGGAIYLAGRTATITSGRVSAPGGASNTSGSGTGGAGSVGRIRIDCATLNGAACPGASGAVASPAANVGAY